MRTSALALLVAAAGTHVAAQTTTAPAGPTVSITPGGVDTGLRGNATVVTNNPAGKVYKATLPKDAFFKAAYPEGGNIEGSFVAVASQNGTGVNFKIKLSNLPKTGGPFMYHLHVQPVPENGNCTATLAHHDPFIRGEASLCNKAYPETCQVGDLSGKYGDIPLGSDTWEAEYTDAYASTLEGIGAFFGNRSIVVHYANKTRITCASFKLEVDGSGGAAPPKDDEECTSAGHAHPTGASNSTVAPTGGRPTPPAPSAPAPTAAGSNLRASGAAVVAFAAAIMFML